MNVPYFDYTARISNDHDVIKSIVRNISRSGGFILKEYVEELEKTISQQSGAEHVIATSNGSTALMLSLKAMGIGENDEVLTPAYSFAASANAIAVCGATPVFVDVDANSGTIDIDDAERKISPRTRAILPVHLHSDQTNMNEVRDLANRNGGIAVLEDSAVCFGARQGNRSCGTLGDIGVYSFFPIKPAGGIGEAGVIVTNDSELAATCRKLRNHGQDGVTRFLHHILGFNARMDEVVAGYLLHRFDRLSSEIKRRRLIASRYLTAFAALSERMDLPRDLGDEQLWYTFVIRSEDREKLAHHLLGQGIQTHVHYRKALPFHQAYSDLGHLSGEFPNAERWAIRALALPLQPEMSDATVEAVINAVLDFY